MRKMIACLSIGLVSLFQTSKVSADEGNPSVNTTVKTQTCEAIYNQIDFGKNKVSFEAFSKAYQGYTNLKRAGKLPGKDIISIADFSLPSTANRLWVIDLAQKKVLFNTYVAHGQGSGNTMAMAFSNNENSHQSSLGFYVTRDTYSGKHGNSLRLDGMDRGFNDKALDRAVVMHAAAYCTSSYVDQNNRLGRSWGCPAVPPQLAQPIINTIKGGTCLFIYAPKADYLKASKWLNA